MRLKVRIYTGEGTRVIHVDSLGKNSIEGYFRNAALRVLAEEIDPLVAARYYYSAAPEDDWEAKTREIATRLFLRRDEHGRRGEHTEEAGTILGWLALENGDIDMALEVSKEVIKAGDEVRDAQGLWSRIASWFDKKEADRIRAESLALRDFALLDQGKALADQGKIEDALALHQEIAEELNKGSPWAWVAWGNALQDTGRIDRAEEKYDEAIRLAPDDPYIRASVGDWFRAAGKIERFEQQYVFATNLAPDDPYLWSGWGSALQEMGRTEEATDKFEKAGQKFETATGLAPDDQYAWSEWGNVLLALERPEEAGQKFERATLLAPGDPDFWSGWGYALQEMGRADEAEEKYQIARDAELVLAKRWAAEAPDNPDSWQFWADTLNAKLSAGDPGLCSPLDGPVAEFLAVAGERAPPKSRDYALSLAKETCGLTQ